MKLLILHGPNMNLFGVRSSKKGDNITLDKINRHIRKFIRHKNIEIKIMQTHSESKAISYLHRNRKTFDGLILTPGPWQHSGYILRDTLDIIELKTVIVMLEENKSTNLFLDYKIIMNDIIFSSYEQALLEYVSK